MNKIKKGQCYQKQRTGRVVEIETVGTDHVELRDIATGKSVPMDTAVFENLVRTGNFVECAPEARVDDIKPGQVFRQSGAGRDWMVLVIDDIMVEIASGGLSRVMRLSTFAAQVAGGTFERACTMPKPEPEPVDPFFEAVFVAMIGASYEPDNCDISEDIARDALRAVKAARDVLGGGK